MRESIAKEPEDHITKLTDQASKLNSVAFFEGFISDGKNILSNLITVASPRSMYLLAKSYIQDREQLGDQRVRVWVPTGSKPDRLVPHPSLPVGGAAA